MKTLGLEKREGILGEGKSWIPAVRVRTGPNDRNHSRYFRVALTQGPGYMEEGRAEKPTANGEAIQFGHCSEARAEAMRPLPRGGLNHGRSPRPGRATEELVFLWELNT